MHLLHYNKIVTATALTVAAPTVTHPVLITCPFVSSLPVLHTKYFAPLKQWNANGHATQNLAATLTATGSAPNAAAMLADDKSHPAGQPR